MSSLLAKNARLIKPREASRKLYLEMAGFWDFFQHANFQEIWKVGSNPSVSRFFIFQEDLKFIWDFAGNLVYNNRLSRLSFILYKTRILDLDFCEWKIANYRRSLQELKKALIYRFKRKKRHLNSCHLKPKNRWSKFFYSFSCSLYINEWVRDRHQEVCHLETTRGVYHLARPSNLHMKHFWKSLTFSHTNNFRT